MTQEDKELLFKDLCARLPYHTKCYCEWSKEAPNGTSGCVQELSTFLIDELEIMEEPEYDCQISGIKPYLRPMSSMTEEEAKQLNSILPCSMSFSYTTGEELIIYTDSEYDGDHYFGCFVDIEDWLNAHHFDFRNLISKGLALEAPEDMYKAE